MLDIIHEILENLLKLAQIKSDKDKNIFDSHIDPIYRDLQLVVANYREILGDVRKQLRENPVSQASTRKIVSNLIEQRKEQAVIRAELKQYAKSLKENTQIREVQNFASAVFDILDIEPVTSEMISQFVQKSPPKTSTATTSLVWDLSKVLHPSPISLRGALSLIKHYEKKIDTLWEVVSQRYYDLKVKYLK